MHKCHIQIKWLIHSEADPASQRQADNLPKTAAHEAYEAALGQGWMDRVDISSDLSIYQLVHRFGGQPQARMLPLGEFTLDFAEPTLTVHTLHSGTALHRELLPRADLHWTPGNDLFRYGSQGQYIQLLDTSEDATITTLAVTDSALRERLGEEAAHRLLNHLGLLEMPALKEASIPMMVSEPLRQSLHSGCSGPLHTLYAESKILEYLWKLATYAGSDRRTMPPDNKSVKTVHAVHAYLLQLEGAMPTLRELADKFGGSPQGLNKSFVQEYGQTIYAMVSNHRLNQAHKALLESGTPIKAVATRLGYSHVNHFIHAFKLKFGYTPGSLRRAV